MDQSKIFLEAIATGKCVTATYNRSSILLAPHILYTRHDALFVDGITLERDGQPPRERKLGAFRLSGLNDATVTATAFTPEPGFNPADDKYAGVTLLAVEA
jgi:hypothetical protein